MYPRYRNNWTNWFLNQQKIPYFDKFLKLFRSHGALCNDPFHSFTFYGPSHWTSGNKVLKGQPKNAKELPRRIAPFHDVVNFPHLWTVACTVWSFKNATETQHFQNVSQPWKRDCKSHIIVLCLFEFIGVSFKHHLNVFSLFWSIGVYLSLSECIQVALKTTIWKRYISKQGFRFLEF